MMYVKVSVCSIVPEIPVQKPTYLNVCFNVAVIYKEVVHSISNKRCKTFAQTGSNVIGLKMDGSFTVPFSYISTQKPFLQVTGMTFLVQQ